MRGEKIEARPTESEMKTELGTLPPGIKEQVDSFWDLIEKLEHLHEGGPSAFVRNKYLIDAGEQGIQFAIGALLDVGDALIKKKGWGPVKPHEIGKVLREKRVLNKEQSEEFKKAVAFREALLQGYARPDPDAFVYIHPQEIYEALEMLRKGIAKVMKAFEDYIRKHWTDSR